MSTTTNIYVLHLQGGAYYVGKSDDPMRRYQEHLDGRGSAWTKLHRPIAVERVIAGASPFDEDKITKELMAKHGIDKVRAEHMFPLNSMKFKKRHCNVKYGLQPINAHSVVALGISLLRVMLQLDLLKRKK
jgi:predicted GIY-YIG superfamily endonuclease